MDKECCRHSWHHLSSSKLASFGGGLLISLGLICCPLHGATAPPLEDRLYTDDAKFFDSQIIHRPDSQNASLAGLPIGASGRQRNDLVSTNVTSLTPNLFIALLYDVDTEAGFALSEERTYTCHVFANVECYGMYSSDSSPEFFDTILLNFCRS